MPVDADASGSIWQDNTALLLPCQACCALGLTPSERWRPVSHDSLQYTMAPHILQQRGSGMHTYAGIV